MEFYIEFMAGDAKTEDMMNPIKMWSESKGPHDGTRPSVNRTVGASWSDTDLHQDRSVSHGYLVSEELTPKAGRCWEDEAVDGKRKEGTGKRLETVRLDEEVGKKKNSIFIVDKESGMFRGHSLQSMADAGVSSGSDCSSSTRKHGPGTSGMSQYPGRKTTDRRNNRSRGTVGEEMEASGKKRRGGITREVLVDGNGKAGKTSIYGSAEGTGNTFQMLRLAERSGQETTDCTGSSGESGTGKITENVYWIKLSEETGMKISRNNQTLNCATPTGRLSTHIIPLRPQTTHETKRHNDVTVTKREFVVTTAEHRVASMTSPNVIGVTRNDVTVSKEPGFSTANKQATPLLQTSRAFADVARKERSSASRDATKASSMTSEAQGDVNEELTSSVAQQVNDAEQRSPPTVQADVLSTYTSVFKVPLEEGDDQASAASANAGSLPAGSFSLSGDFRGVLVGHTNTITHCQVLLSHIVTSSLDSTIRIWHRQLLTQVRTSHYDHNQVLLLPCHVTRSDSSVC